ncbi:MAG: 4-(cytidine 5'-diphospho)-2-C-methyl-D-erythritol kinase [Pirellulaceae bacterium]
MILTRIPGAVLVWAPAKLNLFLEILNRRADGYHEVETLMVAIGIFDTVFFSATDEDSIRLTCLTSAGCRARELSRGASSSLMGDVPESADNLVVRAVARLRAEAGVGAGAIVQLAKRIPASAGLGGASSDAAAALAAANIGWNLGWSRDRLKQLAAGLGSDIPFFFGPGAAICRGRGERIEPLTVPGGMHVVVVRPPEGLSTAEVYRQCSPADQPSVVEPVARALQHGHWSQVGRLLHNRLAPAAEKLTPWISRLRSVFDRVDCLGHQMSGSGSSYYGICRHAGHARRVAARLRGEGLGYVTVATTLTTPRLPP